MRFIGKSRCLFGLVSAGKAPSGKPVRYLRAKRALCNGQAPPATCPGPRANYPASGEGRGSAQGRRRAEDTRRNKHFATAGKRRVSGVDSR
jgi:hypothetical protein